MTMPRDLRGTELWRSVEEHFTKLHSPAFGKISGAADPCACPDGARIAVTGSTWDKLEGRPETRICVVDVATGDLDVVTNGPGEDRLPRWSPDGTRLAFLSDRVQRGRHQLYVLDVGRLGEARAAPPVDGVVEYLWWSPDGSRILLGVAGLGADLAGGQGSGTMTSSAAVDSLPEWIPDVEAGVQDDTWRRLWVYEVASDELRCVSRPGSNVWEAVWCGPDHVAAIVSSEPGEGAWYTAPLALLNVDDGRERLVYRSLRQLGWLAASPSGQRLAVVEAVCSDRWVVAGDVLLIELGEGSVESPIPLFAASIDVTHLQWRDEERLCFLGQRGLETVAGEIDVAAGKAIELWTSPETCGHRYPEGWPLPDGEVAIVRESYTRYPEVAIAGGDGVRTVVSLDHPGGDYLRGVAGTVEEVRWRANDGLEIEGLLCAPAGRQGPHPLVLHVHGGPVWAFRNKWQMTYPIVPLLVSRGYAVLHVNPRGSSGRGQEFAELVFGDMGGDDTDDYLTGIDALVDRGVVDPTRVGVTGGSYGGFMTCWLVTQTDRFAAAVALAPVTDWYSQHHVSNIAYFDRIFLADDPYSREGRYFDRSPVMHAAGVRTPTLLIAGALDRCTPPTQATEFYRALREHDVDAALAIYPDEGHGVRSFPAQIDHGVRVVSWFEHYMTPANSASSRPAGA